MKTAIYFLNDKLAELNREIADHEQSEQVGKKLHEHNPGEFSLESIAVITNKIAVFQSERTDLLKSIEQIKALTEENQKLKRYLAIVAQKALTFLQQVNGITPKP